MSSAEITPISDAVNWSAAAVLGDAQNRIAQGALVLVIWVTSDGKVHFSKNTDLQTEVYISAFLQHHISQSSMWEGV
jgi:hypothetical protein